MRRQYDFAALNLADVEANWSSCQTLEKRLHQYCNDLEYILAQLHIPLKRPDFAQDVSWTDVNVDFQMLHYQFENARNWVSKINSNITGLTGIAGNRQAFREQQLSLNAATRTRNITTVGLLFVPLAYVATLFSMSGEFAPGGDRFWLYFAIALPVTMVVFAAYCSLDYWKVLSRPESKT
jgi:Mg2+ and Co2+ transporter CorA